MTTAWGWCSGAAYQAYPLMPPPPEEHCAGYKMYNHKRQDFENRHQLEKGAILPKNVGVVPGERIVHMREVGVCGSGEAGQGGGGWWG